MYLGFIVQKKMEQGRLDDLLEFIASKGLANSKRWRAQEKA